MGMRRQSPDAAAGCSRLQPPGLRPQLTRQLGRRAGPGLAGRRGPRPWRPVPAGAAGHASSPNRPFRYAAYIPLRFVVVFGRRNLYRRDDAVADARPDRDGCTYPGCTRPRSPDPATGRPSRYCEQADEVGGPMHNRASAFKARRAHPQGGVTTQDDPGTSAPVSMARATLDQRLSELPGRLDDMRSYLGELAVVMQVAGDLEAAGAEVEDAHRDALSKVTDAERRAATAERAARTAEARAEQAERDREEADMLAGEAAAELARVREESQVEIAAIRAEADAAVARAEHREADAAAENAADLAQRDALVEQAQQEVSAARMEAAAAVAAQQASDAQAARERDNAAQLRRELDAARREFDDSRQRLQGEVDAAHQGTQQATAEAAAVRVELATSRAEADSARRVAEQDRAALERIRDETRIERDTLRQAHAEQLAQAQRNADDRVAALTEALAAASSATEALRG